MLIYDAITLMFYLFVMRKPCKHDFILIASRSAYGQILDRGSRSVKIMSGRTCLCDLASRATRDECV